MRTFVQQDEKPILSSIFDGSQCLPIWNCWFGTNANCQTKREKNGNLMIFRKEKSRTAGDCLKLINLLVRSVWNRHFYCEQKEFHKWHSTSTTWKDFIKRGKKNKNYEQKFIVAHRWFLAILLSLQFFRYLYLDMNMAFAL